jgi:hypothetical protein
VSFLSVSGTTLRVSGNTHTTTLRVDNTTTFANANPAAGGGGIDQVYSNISSQDALGIPDEWLVVDINGTQYAIPAYQP